MVSKSRSHDTRSELDAFRPLPHRGQPSENEWSVAIRVFPGLKVVADENAVEAISLGRDGEIVGRFASAVKPESKEMSDAIAKQLKKK